MLKTWFGIIKNPAVITALIFTFSAFYAFLFAQNTSPFFSSNSSPELNLAKSRWEFCNVSGPSGSDCAFTEIKVPSDIPGALMRDFHDWALYRVRFTAPETCISTQSSCAFFFEEIGDAAELSVNGHVIGRHGQFPPNAVYAKHYPASLQVSRDTLKAGENANELRVLVYSSKRVQVGIRQYPVGIYTSENADKLVRRYTILNVIDPLLAFVGLFMIALFSMFAPGSGLDRDPKFAAFIRYAFITSSFLISFSEVPREYLPIWFAGFLHFVLRLGSDWAYFEMVGKYFDFRESTLKKIRPLYVLFILAFIVECVLFFYMSIGGSGNASSGFDVGFTTLKIAVPIIILPHVMGLYGSYKRIKTREGRFLFGMFLVTLIFQIHDSAIFQGLTTGIYLVKWYPFCIGIVFGCLFLERSREARSKLLVEQEQIKQMQMIHEATVGVAHDLEEPLKGLEMACQEIRRNPDNKELVQGMAESFPIKVQRIYELNKAILAYSKELSKPVEVEAEQININEFINSVIAEFQGQPLFEKVDIRIIAPNPRVTIQADPKLLRRVLRNLIKNAGEAVEAVANPQVRIEVQSNRLTFSRVEILVSDNGPGIAPEIRDRLFRPFETFGKEHGTGIGLAISRRLMEAQGGSLEWVESKTGAAFKARI